jgi:hypothetical protein
VDAGKAASEGDALGETGTLDAAAKADVFDDLHAEGFETAEVEVGGAADEVEGTDAESVAF